MKKVFGYNGGYQIKNLEPQIVGETLDKIQNEKGILEPEIVVNCAKDKKNPLHNYFEWDDRLAGEKYRLEQARYLIRAIKVDIIDDEKNTKVEIKRAYTNLKEVSSGYMPTEKILDDRQLTFLMIKQAQKELLDFKERYKNLLELSEIFQAIDLFIKKAS